MSGNDGRYGSNDHGFDPYDHGYDHNDHGYDANDHGYGLGAGLGVGLGATNLAKDVIDNQRVMCQVWDVRVTHYYSGDIISPSILPLQTPNLIERLIPSRS